MQIGRDRHPDRPYSDPRVTVHVDDGRAFMERTDARYDLVLFALPDSATIVTGQSALRLENYLFTTQALDRARSLLRPGGTFAMYNYYEPWLLDRYANTIRTVYGTAPACSSAPPTASASRPCSRCATTPRPAAARPPGPHGSASSSRRSTTGRSPTSGTRTIPSFYLSMLALVLLASLVLVRLVGGPLRQMAPYTDLFFMGGRVPAARDQERGAVRAALRHHLGGQRRRVRRRAAQRAGGDRGGPAGAHLAAPLAVCRAARRAGPGLGGAGDLLLDLPPVPRFVAGVTIAFLPIFIANLLFAVRFKGVGSSTTAFGANLLGAMVGGALEYLALILGFNALLVIVALCYSLAFLTGRKHLMPGCPWAQGSDRRGVAAGRGGPVGARSVGQERGDRADLDQAAGHAECRPRGRR